MIDAILYKEQLDAIKEYAKKNQYISLAKISEIFNNNINDDYVKSAIINFNNRINENFDLSIIRNKRIKEDKPKEESRIFKNYSDEEIEMLFKSILEEKCKRQN